MTPTCNVLHVNWNVPLPHPHGLVVTGGDKPPVPVHEGDGVDSSQMTVVLLDDVSTSDVPADDLVGAGARHYQVLSVVIGVKLDTEGHLVVGEPPHHVSSLRVPHLDGPVVAGRQEPVARVVEIDIPDGQLVSHVRPDASSLVVDLPQLHLVVDTAGEEEMGRGGEPTDDGDALVVSLPRVDLSLRDETFGWRISGLEIDSEVLRGMKERTALIVRGVLHVESRLLLQRNLVLHLSSLLSLGEIFLQVGRLGVVGMTDGLLVLEFSPGTEIALNV